METGTGSRLLRARLGHQLFNAWGLDRDVLDYITQTDKVEAAGTHKQGRPA